MAGPSVCLPAYRLPLSWTASAVRISLEAGFSSAARCTCLHPWTDSSRPSGSKASAMPNFRNIMCVTVPLLIGSCGGIFFSFQAPAAGRYLVGRAALVGAGFAGGGERRHFPSAGVQTRVSRLRKARCPGAFEKQTRIQHSFTRRPRSLEEVERCGGLLTLTPTSPQPHSGLNVDFLHTPLKQPCLRN